MLSSLECLIVKIKDSLFLTFRIKVSAHESLQSMNVHLIVNQIKVEEKEEGKFDEYRGWRESGTRQTFSICHHRFNLLIDIETVNRCPNQICDKSRSIHADIEIMDARLLEIDLRVSRYDIKELVIETI